MQRGVYFDGWFPNQHNYHPSLPPRRLRMVEELTDMRATMLVWSALGGGSVSLPYLEEEAYGAVPDRFRMHGFVNDADFIARCRENGIEVFGVVFEAQGWEFPAETADDGAVLSLNELRGVGTRTWMGLREFTQDAGPANWKPFRHYFPDGLVNSRGEEVVDLWDECTSRDIDGVPIRADWVEVPAREHVAHFMDRNNPVWREYLKAIIRIQIDAGVSGVQLDESETPFGALGYGGCFCYDCMDQFRDYLASLDVVPEELSGLDLSTFDYRGWLTGQGFTDRPSAMRLPLHQHFLRFNLRAMQRHFREIADYIREYAAERGRTVKVAGNFYNGNPEFDALVEKIDVLVTEMHDTRYAQPWWFRHLEGLGRGRDVLVVENPYGGIVPELVDSLAHGRAYDRFRISVYEAPAMGPSMTFPYGSWLGSRIQDSFSAPKALLDECGGFLETIDAYRSHRSVNEVAVLFPVADAMQAEFDGPRWIRDDVRGTSAEPPVRPVAYWPAIEALGGAGVPYDCIPLPDERERANDVTAAALGRYTSVVLAGCATVSADQHAELVGYVRAGGHVVLLGEYATGLGPAGSAELVAAGRVDVVERDAQLAAAIDPQIRYDGAAQLAFNTHALADGSIALHVVNYDYDTAADRAVRHRDVRIDVRVPTGGTRAEIVTERGERVDVPLREVDGRARIDIPDLGICTIVHIL